MPRWGWGVVLALVSACAAFGTSSGDPAPDASAPLGDASSPLGDASTGDASKEPPDGAAGACTNSHGGGCTCSAADCTISCDQPCTVHCDNGVCNVACPAGSLVECGFGATCIVTGGGRCSGGFGGTCK